jgi:voltage-gated potassium channel
MEAQRRRRATIPRSLLARAAYSLVLVALVVLVGTLAMHQIEGWSYLDSFYFTSFVATGQGPPASLDPQSAVGKVFASVLAFVSVGTVISALLFIFGPFFGRVFRAEAERIEELERRDRGAKEALHQTAEMTR